MKEALSRYFAWRCSRGSHGPSRVKWGFRRNCEDCARLAWKWGY